MTSDRLVTVKGHGIDAAVRPSKKKGAQNPTAETGGETAANGNSEKSQLRCTGTNKLMDDLSNINQVTQDAASASNTVTVISGNHCNPHHKNGKKHVYITDLKIGHLAQYNTSLVIAPVDDRVIVDVHVILPTASGPDGVKKTSEKYFESRVHSTHLDQKGSNQTRHLFLSQKKPGKQSPRKSKKNTE